MQDKNTSDPKAEKKERKTTRVPIKLFDSSWTALELLCSLTALPPETVLSRVMFESSPAQRLGEDFAALQDLRRHRMEELLCGPPMEQLIAEALAQKREEE